MWIIKIWQPFLCLTLILSSASALSSYCDSSCGSCNYFNDSTSCTSCSNSNYVLLLVNDDYGPCIDPSLCSNYGGLIDVNRHKCFIGGSCPPGYFTSSPNCNPCSSNCQECYGGNNNQCTSCLPGYVLRLDNDDAGTCILQSQCTSPYTFTGTICVSNTTTCASNCATCYSNSTCQCRSCSSNSTTKYLLLLENYNSTDQWGQCTTNVSTQRKHYNFGFDPANEKVQFKCHWTCQTCVSENDRFFCTSCSNYSYLSILGVVNGASYGYCKPTCSASNEYNLVLSARKYCQIGGCPLASSGATSVTGSTSCSFPAPCSDSTCALCSSQNGTSTCTFCAQPLNWLKLTSGAKSGSCVSSVATSQYFSAYGILKTYTDTCPSGNQIVDNIYCTIGNCPSTCLSCGSSTSACWRCQNNTVVMPDSSGIEGICGPSPCASGYSLSTDGLRCSPCNSACGTCQMPRDPGMCLTCPGANLLKSNSPNFCVSGCDVGQTNNSIQCIAQSSSSTTFYLQSDNSKWYTGAIIIGVITMLAFFGFIVFVIINWDKSGEEGESQHPSNFAPPAPPPQIDQPAQPIPPAPMIPPNQEKPIGVEEINPQMDPTKIPNQGTDIKAGN